MPQSTPQDLLRQAIGVCNQAIAAIRGREHDGFLRYFIAEVTHHLAAPQPAAQEVPAVQDVMWEVFEYARLMNGFEALEGKERDERRAAALTQERKIRALLAASQPARSLTQPEVQQLHYAEYGERALADSFRFLEAGIRLFAEVNGIPLKGDAAGGEKSK